jgi:basic membrane protein A and related proteins
MEATMITRRTMLKGGAAVLGATAIAGGLPRAWAADPLKVGIVHLGAIGDVGWEAQHAFARQAMEAALPGQVEVTVVTEVSQAQDAERVFRELAVKGNKLLFGTTFSQMAPMLKVAPTLPDTVFECNTAIQTLPNLGAFEAKYYESTYLAGVVAGHMTESNILGWVGAFPYPNVLMALNGFVLGARSVNPAIVCKLVWVNSWSDPAKEKEAVNALISQGADVVCGNPNTPVQGQEAESKGVWSVGFASDYSKYVPNKQLTSYILDWSSAYIEAAQAVIAGTWESKNRWLGVGPGGYTKLAPLNAAVPQDVAAKVAQLEADIAGGKLHPFAGPIKDQAGAEKVAAGAVLPDDQIRSINWLVEGVEGQIPG